MKSHIKQNKSGFTLIEMLLVLVIIAMILYASIGYFQQRAQATRIDKTTATMQQILNAALAFYVANGRWPNDLNEMSSANGYLPNVPLVNPWGQPYQGQPGQANANPPPSVEPPPRLFFVWTQIPASNTASAVASQIAGPLPLAYSTSDSNTPPTTVTACAPGAACQAVASVNIPGQNLNNANAITFAGLYHQGGCVPVPECPVDANDVAMTPQIMVAPVSVGGYNDPNSTNAYPITSFTAYAVGSKTLDTAPPACEGETETPPSCTVNYVGNPANAYWRVCLKVITEKGDVQSAGNTTWGQYVTMLAVTRCAITQEPSGSNFNVFGN